MLFFSVSLGTRECSCPSRSRSASNVSHQWWSHLTRARPRRSDVEIFQRLRDRSVIGRARWSLSERACSVGDRGSPHSSRDGFAPPLAQRAAAREQRLAGARRRGASRPRHFLHRHRHGRVRRERRARAVPRDGCPDVGTASRAHARVFPARVAARTRSPPRPRGRPARPDRARHRLAPLGFLAVWANSQDERLFLVDFSATRRGDDDARVFAPSTDARLFVHARHTTYPRLTRSLSSFPSTSPKRRATTSAGRTATRCPCSWMAWRRTCRKA